MRLLKYLKRLSASNPYHREYQPRFGGVFYCLNFSFGTGGNWLGFFQVASAERDVPSSEQSCRVPSGFVNIRFFLKVIKPVIFSNKIAFFLNSEKKNSEFRKNQLA
jgi:hypothetical protein